MQLLGHFTGSLSAAGLRGTIILSFGVQGVRGSVKVEVAAPIRGAKVAERVLGVVSASLLPMGPLCQQGQQGQQGQMPPLGPLSPTPQSSSQVRGGECVGTLEGTLLASLSEFSVVGRLDGSFDSCGVSGRVQTSFDGPVQGGAFSAVVNGVIDLLAKVA